ncbi:MAG: FG-GAP-like repeat-containing protein [Dehalococcoidia bacterium]
MTRLRRLSVGLLFVASVGLAPPIQAAPVSPIPPSSVRKFSRQATGPTAPVEPLAVGQGAGGLFVEPLSLPLTWKTSEGPSGVATADFNRDGILDLATSHTKTDSDGQRGRVSVLLGQGGGQFGPPLTAALPLSGTVSGFPSGILAKDFDGDSVPDLAVPVPQQRRVVVFKGLGNGALGPGIGAPALVAATELQTADLNGDGALDLVTIGPAGAGGVAVLLGAGNGTFAPPTVYTTTASFEQQDFALGDLNGDNRPDLVVGTTSFTAGLGVRLNDGTGGFGPQNDINTTFAVTGLYLADFDGDGKRDVAAGGRPPSGDRSVGFLKGNGDGTFVTPASQLQPIETEPVRLGSENIATDLNGDGKLDVIFSSTTVNQLSVGLNNGSGGFSIVTYVASNGPPGEVAINVAIEPIGRSVVAADFTGDGRPDLAVAAAPANGIAGTLGIIPATSTGFAAPRRGGYGPRSQGDVALGDVTGDGRIDLVSNVFQAGLQVRPGGGDGSFGAAIVTPPTPNLNGAGALGPIRLADFDKDGALDILTFGNSFGFQGAIVTFGAGNGVFTATRTLTFTLATGLGNTNALVGDLNSDGFQDVVVAAASTTSQIQYEAWLYTGSRTFTRSQHFTVGGQSCRGATVGDFDGDGRLDLITCVERIPIGWDFSFFKGSGTGSFAAGVPFSSLLFGVASQDMKSADVNGDGKLDLLATVGGAPGNVGPAETLIEVFLGNGNGAFAQPSLYSSGFALAIAIAIADFTNDSKLDLAVAHGHNIFGNGMSILPGNGDGSFGGPERFAVGAISQSGVAAGDLNGDTRPDIVAANGASASGNSFVALLNSGVNVPDLAPAAVTFPGNAAPGAQIDLTYVVENTGLAFASGAWHDAVFLSQDDAWDADDLLLSSRSHSGPLAPGARYTETVGISVPGLLPGPYRLIVHTDSRQRLLEVDKTNNLLTAPAFFTVNDAPLLTLGGLVSGALQPGQSRYFRLAGLPGRDLKLVATFGGAFVADFLVRYALPPSRSAFDLAYPRFGDTSQTLYLPQSQGGFYYILLFGREGAAGGKSFQLLATAPGATIDSVSPARGGNLGRTTVTIVGAGLPISPTVVLSGAGGTRTPVATMVKDSTTLFATFDLAGAAPGVYDLSVDGNTRSGAFVVVEGGVGKVVFHTSVTPIIRPGREATVVLNYRNVGESDLVAPLFTIGAEFGRFRHPDESDYLGDSVEILGINPNGPAGILPPGASGIVELQVLPTVVGADVNTEVNAGLVVASAAMDWGSRQDALRPSYIAADAWAAIFATFVAEVGTTAGQYQAVLADNATALSRLGIITGRVSRLLGFELLQADAFGEISQRHRLGAFGRGAADPTAYRLIPNGDAMIVQLSDSVRPFLKQPDGTYRGLGGDAATLSFSTGVGVVREPDGRRWVFRADTLIDFLEDPAGRRTTFASTGGRVTSVTDPFGDTTTYAYNAQSRISQLTDPTGRVTTFTYDASGDHLTEASGPVGTSRYRYVSGMGAAREHALADATGPDGVTTAFEYDARGRLVRATTSGQQPLTFAYDSASGISTTDAAGGRTTVFLNDDAQPGLQIDALGRTTRIGFDAFGRISRVGFPNGATTTAQYDARGFLSQLVDGLGGRAQLSGEPVFGQVLNARDALGRTTSFAYDAKRQLVSEADAAGAAIQYQYDALGNLVRVVNGRGGVVLQTFDTKGLLTRKDLPDGSRVDFAYDARRNLVATSEISGAVTLPTAYSWDGADRLTGVTYPSGRTISYAYDAAGRRTRLQTSDGHVVQYAYDSLGRLIRIADGAGTTLTSYLYDPVGRVTETDHANGARSTFEYDAAGQISRVIHGGPGGELGRFEYQYDSLSRPVTVTTGAETWRYGYDGLGQLTSVVVPGTTLSYDYDAAGNRIRSVSNGVGSVWTTNVLNQYTAVGSATYQYDLDGNLSSRTGGPGAATYRYDAENRLVRADVPGLTTTFDYDPFGNLRAAVRNGVRTEYLVDLAGASSIVAEHGPGGTPIAHYSYGLGLASRRDAGGALTYYAFDGAGNTSHLTDGSGALAASYRMLPFGDGLVKSGSAPNPFTFAGQAGVLDGGAGWFWMRQRWYDPSLGRLVSRDPVGLTSGDLNPYRYALNAPTIFGDPLGLMWLPGGPVISPYDAVQGARAVQALVSADNTRQAVQAYHYTRAALNTSRMWQILHQAGGQLGRQAAGQAARQTGIRALAAPPIAAVAVAAAIVIVPLKIWADNIPNYGKTTPPAYDEESVRQIFNPKAVQKIEDDSYFKYCRSLGISYETCLTLYFGQRTSGDPNDIVGPLGRAPDLQRGNFGDLDDEFALPYTIRFENMPSAGAPAQSITVTQTLDPDLDVGSFELDTFGFGGRRFAIPPGRTFYQQQVAISSTLTVLFTATIDPTTGAARWTFASLDPATGDLTGDPMAGLLPPNKTPPEGEGFVSYRVRMRSGLELGTRIDAQARIFFDSNAPIDTPPIFNTYRPFSAFAPQVTRFVSQ